MATTCTPVTGNSAQSMTDTTSSTNVISTTKALSQQSTHHQASGGSNYNVRSVSTSSDNANSVNTGATKKSLSPVDLKGMPLYSSVSNGYASSNSKVNHRSNTYNGYNGNNGGGNNASGSGGGGGGGGGPRGRGGNNNNSSYRNYQPPGRRYSPTTHFSRPQVDSWPLPSPPQMSHFGAEPFSSVISPLVPLAPAQLPNYCQCALCQPSTGSGFLPNHSYYPAFAYYPPVFPHQMPAIPQQACYPGYLQDGQLMFQPQISHFQPPPTQEQPVSYAATMVRPQMMTQKVNMNTLPFPRVSVDGKNNNHRSVYDLPSGQWIPPSQLNQSDQFTDPLSQGNLSQTNAYPRYP